MRRMTLAIGFLLVCGVLAAVSSAGEWPRELRSFRGTTPTIDGVISEGEWDDASQLAGVKDWTPQFTPTTDGNDLSLIGYVKHDTKRIYFAFDVTDDILYGIDTDRWLPDENAKAHELTQEGYPWLGDEMELLINATNAWGEGENCAGDGTAWQMVCNLTKSRLGGVGVGGLLEGEPRVKQSAWDNYQKWILDGSQEASAKVKPGGKGYVIEWAASFDPCLEMAPGKFYSADMPDTPMGLNIALGDLDERATGEGNFGNFHHEDWFAGEKITRTHVEQWGTLWMMRGPAPPGK